MDAAKQSLAPRVEAIQFSSSANLSFKLEKWLHDADNKRFWDVHIETDDGTQVHANRFDLASCSEYFQRLFQGSFSDTDAAVARISGFSAAAVRKLLQTLYTSQVSGRWEDVAELLALSNNLQVVGVELASCALLEARLVPERAVATYCLADKYSCQDLKLAARSYIVNGLEAILNCHVSGEVEPDASFAALPDEDFEAILCDNNLVISSELVVLRCAAVRLQLQSRSLENYVNEYFHTVRVEHMALWELQRLVQQFQVGTKLLMPQLLGQTLLNRAGMKTIVQSNRSVRAHHITTVVEDWSYHLATHSMNRVVQSKLFQLLGSDWRIHALPRGFSGAEKPHTLGFALHRVQGTPTITADVRVTLVDQSKQSSLLEYEDRHMQSRATLNTVTRKQEWKFIDDINIPNSRYVVNNSVIVQVALLDSESYTTA